MFVSDVEREVGFSEVFPHEPRVQSGAMKDLTRLLIVNEATVVHIVKERFESNMIYTYARPLLVVVNPFRELGNTTEEFVHEYRSLLPPLNSGKKIYICFCFCND